MNSLQLMNYFNLLLENSTETVTVLLRRLVNDSSLSKVHSLWVRKCTLELPLKAVSSKGKVFPAFPQ